MKCWPSVDRAIPLGLVLVACAARVVAADTGDPDKARRALATIDGVTSVGEPWHGELVGGAKLEPGPGYTIERPARAFGAPHVLAYLRSTIGEVCALYPDVPALPIWDLSAEHGGKISDHRSHQSGLDVDLGYYTKRGVLDLEATWALVVAFGRTADRPDGVEMIFLDYDLQRRLYDWARARGTPESALAFVLQYPRGKTELAGLVRHWPGHTDHLHVRFKAPAR
jgi:murein endopeptidase